MPRQGRKRKKTRTQAGDVENALLSSEEAKIPKSLVIRRGKCDTHVADLVQDVRKIMMPYTASNFKEDANYRKLTLSKYAQHVCLPLGISHMIVFSQNKEKLNVRIGKTPQGPTLTFRVHQFSLSKHVQKLQRRPVNTNTLTANPPIVVTNNFGHATAPPQVKLMRITFQNMFPAINVSNVKLRECRRVVLFHLIENGSEGQQIEVRHYAIKATPVGVNRKVRRLIQTKIPNLNKVQDIADYIAGTGNIVSTADAASDSEAEENSAVVELAQNYAGKGNTSQSKSALKLVELGPRLTMQLIKVEQGLGEGNVMFHAFVHKTPEEAKEIQERKDKEARLKQRRREEQERNVERKRKSKEEKREAKRQRKKEREEAALDELRRKEEEELDNDNEDDADIEDLLAEYTKKGSSAPGPSDGDTDDEDNNEADDQGA